MAKVYRTRCIVIRDNKQYSKGAIIEGLSDEEIKRGLTEHWIEEVGSKNEETEANHSGSDAARKALLKEAAKYNIAYSKDTTDEEIQRYIDEAKARQSANTNQSSNQKSLEQMSKDELKVLAKELGIDAGLFDSEEKLRQKIREVKG